MNNKKKAISGLKESIKYYETLQKQVAEKLQLIHLDKADFPSKVNPNEISKVLAFADKCRESTHLRKEQELLGGFITTLQNVIYAIDPKEYHKLTNPKNE